MGETMKAKLSALADGELERHELPALCNALSGSEGLRADWQNFRLIGDAIRQEEQLNVDLCARVMAALDNEPTVLAPARAAEFSPRSTWRGAMAMAATFAGVSVVGWMTFSQQAMSPLPIAAQVALTPSKSVTTEPVAAANGRMQEYLVAHQTYSPGAQMQSGTRYIRTVAAAR